MQPKDLLRRSFDNVYDRYPWFAAIASSLEVRPMTEMEMNAFRIVRGFEPTAATDGKKLYYNPAFVQSLKISECTDLLLHELGHIFLGHHRRFENKPADQWNVAGDLALNSNLINHFDQTGKIRLEGCFPGEAQFRDLPREKSAEFYYEAIHREQQKKQKPEQGDGEEGGEEEGQGGAEGDEEGKKGTGQSQGSAGEEGTDDADAGGSGDGEDGEGVDQQQGQQQDGMSSGQPSQAGVKPLPQSTYAGQPLPHSPGEILPDPATFGTEEEQMEAEEQWKQQVARGINDAKSCGNLPGWVEELGEALYAKKSDVNWKLYLRRFMTRYAPVRYSYAKPSRRHAHRTDIMLPARHSREASSGAILVDTSGSMQQHEMDAALNEMTGILTAFSRADVTLFECDMRLITDPETATVYSRWDLPLRSPHTWKGRGGTDLSPAIEQIGEARKYKWLVVVTDAAWQMGNAEDPGIPTLWLCTRDPGGSSWQTEPTFGKVVRLTVEAD